MSAEQSEVEKLEELVDQNIDDNARVEKEDEVIKTPAKVGKKERIKKDESATEIVRRIEEKIDKKLSLSAYTISTSLFVSAGTYYQVGDYKMFGIFVALGIVTSVFGSLTAALKRNNIDVSQLLKGKSIKEMVLDLTDTVYRK